MGDWSVIVEKQGTLKSCVMDFDGSQRNAEIGEWGYWRDSRAFASSWCTWEWMRLWVTVEARNAARWC